MSLTVNCTSVLLVIFHLFFFAVEVYSYKFGPPSVDIDSSEKTLKRSTRGIFIRNEESQVTDEYVGAKSEDKYRVPRRERNNSSRGGRSSETKYKNIHKNEAIEKYRAIHESRRTSAFPHRSILQAQSRWSANRQPVKYQLYEEAVALSLTKLWSTEWIPEADLFLMAYCQSGRLSNRVFCLLNALNFAAVLNRTLLITMDQNAILYHYDRRVIFDIGYFRSCYGDKTLMTVQEYRDIYGKDVIVDQIVCLCGKPCRLDFSNPNATFLNQGHVTFLESALNFKRPRVYVRYVSVDELKLEIGETPGRILFMGEFFYNHLLSENRIILPVKRSDHCRSNAAVLPHPSLLEFGKLFVKDVFQGGKYMAVHLRREDFEVHCNRKLGCFLPIERIVECLKEKVEVYDVKVIFLATNTNHHEVTYISHNLTDKNSQHIQLVRLRTELMKDDKWVLPIPKEDEEVQGLWEAQLDKIVCLYAPIFVGSPRSTFTDDIERLRYAFGYATSKDTYLCEEPRL